MCSSRAEMIMELEDYRDTIVTGNVYNQAKCFRLVFTALIEILKRV